MDIIDLTYKMNTGKFSFGIDELCVSIVTLPKGKNTVISRTSVIIHILGINITI